MAGARLDIARPTDHPARPSDLAETARLAGDFARLDSRAARLRRLASKISGELKSAEYEMEDLGGQLADLMACTRVWVVKLIPDVSLVRREAPRALLPLWPANQFPEEYRQEIFELDEQAIRVELGSSDVLLNTDGIELARLGPPRMVVEVRRGDSPS
jgi:hypothetical protein